MSTTKDFEGVKSDKLEISPINMIPENSAAFGYRSHQDTVTLFYTQISMGCKEKLRQEADFVIQILNRIHIDPQGAALP
ncbi:hypothetical protein [Desulfococcus multivorans]|uniref:hypothetical protein n=1 Tax=Desulfococcus multivorans TaxID=897 RepID=UPI00146BE2BC|nr:hypothetical protein [Desulfococcus multivorans]